MVKKMQCRIKIEQYFPVVLFILPYKVVRISDTYQMIYVIAALITMLYRVVLTFKSVDETLVCDHSNESY